VEPLLWRLHSHSEPSFWLGELTTEALPEQELVCEWFERWNDSSVERSRRLYPNYPDPARGNTDRKVEKQLHSHRQPSRACYQTLVSFIVSKTISLSSHSLFSLSLLSLSLSLMLLLLLSNHSCSPTLVALCCDVMFVNKRLYDVEKLKDALPEELYTLCFGSTNYH